MPAMPAGFYDRFDPTKNYERHLFRAGKVLQGAELNELEAAAQARLQSVGNALFRDGDIVRDAVVVIDSDTGVVSCSSGAVYLQGAVRGVPTGSFTIPTTGTHTIGIRLNETVVTETDDAALNDPAVGLRNYGQPGAARLKVEPVWGWDGDGSTSRFFPMFTADNAVLRAKAPPPQFDAVKQAIAKYDRDSAGGTYVVSGMNVLALADSGTDQVYSISEGSVRLRGNALDFPTARRLIVDPVPDLRFASAEPHLSSTAAAQRIDLNLYPVANVVEVTITKEITETVTHGAFVGAQDTLANSSVLSLISVVQGGTTYVADTDYQLTAGKVDWSLPGAEPATGSTYTVTYQYVTTVTPTAVDNKGFTVTGAVSGTLILVDYNQYLPRYDRICVTEQGTVILVKGVAAAWNPAPPEIPETLLPLAAVYQTWDSARVVTNDAVKVVPMSDIAKLNGRIDSVLLLVAQQRLESTVHTRETGLIKGLFVDPFIDDSFRDAGIAQSGAVFSGTLNLPVVTTAATADNRTAGAASLLAYTAGSAAVQQLARTGSMQVNPYFAFAAPPPSTGGGSGQPGDVAPPATHTVPPSMTLSPSVDRWWNFDTSFNTVDSLRSWMLQRVPGLSANASLTNLEKAIRDGQWSDSDVWRKYFWAREITVNFSLTGFAAAETISSITMDGIAVVSPGGYTYGSVNGVRTASGHFTVPANIPPGVKQVVVTGSAGTQAIAQYTSLWWNFTGPDLWTWVRPARIDPLAQTFTLDAAEHLSAVDLWFTAKGTSTVGVQILETSNGVPTQRILGEARMDPVDITIDGTPTRFNFAAPVPLSAGVEYAIVVLCDDAVTAVSIAELGKQDTVTSQWVTSQPYTVGVLLSSSNASTWTAHQDRDLTFRLIPASFTATTRTIALGNVAVTGVTDLAIRATVQSPSADCTCRFSLTMPDSTVYYVSADQLLQLPAAVTGNIAVAAILNGTSSLSPILHRDVQMLTGVVGGTGEYVSRAMTGGTSVVVKIIVEVELPGSSSIAAAYKATADGSWTNVTGPTAVTLPDGWTELTYTSGTVTKADIKTNLTLTGTTAARPRARNLRVSVV